MCELGDNRICPKWSRPLQIHTDEKIVSTADKMMS